jgi:hypothetical protein
MPMWVSVCVGRHSWCLRRPGRNESNPLYMRVTHMVMPIIAGILICSGWLHVQSGQPFPDIPLGLALTSWGMVMLGWGRNRHVWMATCALCACLLTFATITWIRGEDDCGCFPGFRVPPAITTALDVVMLVSLLASRSAISSTSRKPSHIRWLGVATVPVVFIGALWLVPRVTDQPWPQPLDRGDWRVIAVREGCNHCDSALSWIIPMANAEPGSIALLTYTPSSDWLRNRGLSQSVPVVIRPSRWDHAPAGWILRDGVTQRSFPIPDSVTNTSDDE